MVHFLLPCPFCGGRAEVEQAGTRLRSCIVACSNCGCRHESGDEEPSSGRSWNMRHTLGGTFRSISRTEFNPRRVFVVRSTVEHNAETGEAEPVFMMLDEYGVEHRGSNIGFDGPATLRYDPNQAYGKRVWIESLGKVVLTDGSTETVFAPVVETRSPD
jgi:Lar family restriction alleviation protein